ncbi:MAG TPA: hypothetical protein EYN66_14695, partial [Myxococcales bacterium]|nr:hypothetical protein [Myxococcales bacterium]
MSLIAAFVCACGPSDSDPLFDDELQISNSEPTQLYNDDIRLDLPLSDSVTAVLEVPSGALPLGQ